MEGRKSKRLKSSALRPLNRSLASQLEVQQHLLAHYRHIDESKARVDSNKPSPTFLRSIWTNKNNKEEILGFRQRSQSSTPTTTCSSSNKQMKTRQRRQFIPLAPQSKNVATRSVAVHNSCSVAHKITWYLEAIKSHTFCARHGNAQNCHAEKTNPRRSNNGQVCLSMPQKSQRKITKTHKDVKHSEIPCRLQNIESKYSVTDGMLEVPHYQTWLREQAVRAKMRKGGRETASSSDSGRETERSSPAVNLKKLDDGYKVDFLSQVTEDILHMGLFSNRAIKKAIEFHVEQNKSLIHEDELQELSYYLMENLNIAKIDDSALSTSHNLNETLGR